MTPWQRVCFSLGSFSFFFSSLFFFVVVVAGGGGEQWCRGEGRMQ